jgi:hypothetical protein
VILIGGAKSFVGNERWDSGYRVVSLDEIGVNFGHFGTFGQKVPKTGLF